MKYIRRILLCLLLSLTPLVFAEDCGNSSCKISDAPAPALTEYLKNIEVMMDNIIQTAQWWDANEPSKSEFTQMKNRVLGSLSSTLSFKNYFWEFDFFLSQHLTRDIPEQAKRDYDALQLASEKLSSILKRVEERWIWWVVMENPCESMEYCDFSEESVRNMLIELIKNNNAITQSYVSAVLWKPALWGNDFMLVAPDFSEQLLEYYSPDVLYDCSKCEGGFSQRTSDIIGEISLDSIGAKTGIQAWKDAWNMVRGGSSAAYKAQEQAILAGFLETQGISDSQQWVVMDNLDRYNAWWLSTSNPIGNSIDYTVSEFVDDTQSIKDAMSETFSQKADEEETPWVELIRVDTGIQHTQDISQRLADTYEMMQPFALTQDTSAQSLQLRMINMHASLMRSINMLEWKKTTSEKNCDKQWQGKGKCQYE